MSIIADAWAVFVDSWKAQRELDRKRKQFIDVSKQPLNYLIIEDCFKAAAKQQPGFYCKITVGQGQTIEFGIHEKTVTAGGRRDAETF